LNLPHKVIAKSLKVICPKSPKAKNLIPMTYPLPYPAIYLINLKAQLKLDGEIVAESGSFTMGQ